MNPITTSRPNETAGDLASQSPQAGVARKRRIARRRLVPAILAVLLAATLGAIGLYRREDRSTAPARGASAGLALTVWGERFELFIDAQPIVVHQQARLACHVTNLQTGAPLDSGSISLTAVGGQEHEVQPRSVRRAQPGIFIAEFVFNAPASYELRAVVTPAGEPPESLRLAGLRVHGSSADVEPDRDRAGERTIRFTKDQQWRVGILSQAVGRRELVARLVVPGCVRTPSGASAIVTPPAAGTLYPPSGGRFPRVGEIVEKDQALAMLEPSLAGPVGVQLLANRVQLESLDAELAVKQLQLETAAKVAERELAVARRTLARVESLVSSGTTTAKQVDQARLDVQLAEQRLQGAQEQLHPYAEARARLAAVLGRSTGDSPQAGQADLRVALHSPLRGTVVEARATAGQYLNVGERIFQIVNLDTMWIEARVSEYDLGRVQKAPGASYRLSAYPDQLVPILGAGGGRLIDVGAVVDPQNRTVPVRYEVPNPEGRLRVDMFAEVLIETSRQRNSLAVPVDAVLDEGPESLVIVQEAGEMFREQPVKLGIRDAGWVEVVDGLAAGQRVVVRGARVVRVAALSAAMPAHQHEH
jgi:RND family efflux transporter MFP subunit